MCTHTLHRKTSIFRGKILQGMIDDACGHLEEFKIVGGSFRDEDADGGFPAVESQRLENGEVALQSSSVFHCLGRGSAHAVGNTDTSRLLSPKAALLHHAQYAEDRLLVDVTTRYLCIAVASAVGPFFGGHTYHGLRTIATSPLRQRPKGSSLTAVGQSATGQRFDCIRCTPPSQQPCLGRPRSRRSDGRTICAWHGQALVGTCC